MQQAYISHEEATQQPHSSHMEATQKTYRSHTEATQKPYSSHTAATQQPHSCHIEAAQQPYSSHTEATQQPRNSHIEATHKPHRSHTETTQKPHRSHTAATQKPHRSHTAATQQPYRSHTAATQQPYRIVNDRSTTNKTHIDVSENVSQHLEHWVIREIDPGPNKAPQHVFCTQIIWYSRKLILVQPMPASNNIYLDFVVRQTTLVVLNNVPSLKSNMTESEKYLVTDTNSFNQCWISILYISYIPAVQIGWPDDDTIDSFMKASLNRQ